MCLRDARAPAAEPRGIAGLNFLCLPAVLELEGVGLAGECFEDAARATIFDSLGEAFATNFFSPTGLFAAADLLTALSLSR